jgi:hypothetical protein
MIKQTDDKTWEAGFLLFKDLGKIEGGVTHKYEVRSKDDFEAFTDLLGWIEWKSGWRRYIFRPILGASTRYDFSCLTTLAEFCKIQTEERKSHWSTQGRFADRA